MRDHCISRNSSIILNLRLHGGASGPRNPGDPISYTDSAQMKGSNIVELPDYNPGHYIAEQMKQDPSMVVNLSEVNHLFSTLQFGVVICRFNGLWPRSDLLHQWVFSNWRPNYDIYLCYKGFFIVQFNTQEEIEIVMKNGPWFWGRVGLFITPCFPYFDAKEMVVLTNANLGQTSKPSPFFPVPQGPRG